LAVPGKPSRRSLPPTVTHVPLTRGQICRTAAYRPGNPSEVLTGHYRRPIPKRPASLPDTWKMCGGLFWARDHLCHRGGPEDARSDGAWLTDDETSRAAPPSLCAGFRLDAGHDAGRPVLGILCVHEPDGRGPLVTSKAPAGCRLGQSR
jgi:hypothetical protein